MHPPARYARYTLSLLAAVLLALAGTASPAVAQEEVPTVDYDVEDLEYPPLPDFPVPEPERLELENGMLIFLLEDHELPQIQATAHVATGSVYEPAEKVGLASVTGTAMRTGGTASLGPDSLNQVLEGLGASVETSIGETSGSAYMSTLREAGDTVLPIFADVLRRPAFAEEKVGLAKSQQKSRISRRNDNPQQIAFREFEKVLYGEDSPYARHSEYFTVDAIGRDDVVGFHESYYHPANVILSVWGDFEADRMKERLREAFGDWRPEGEVTEPTPPTPSARQGPSVNFVQKDDVTQSTILMGHAGELERDDPDYPPVIVMNEVLSGGFTGRLFQNVRKEQGLAYSVFGNYGAGYDRPDRFFAGIASKSATTVEAAEAVMHEVERMRQAPPEADELELAKDSYLNSFVFNFDTKREILDRLMTYEHHGYPSHFLQRTKDAVEQVSADDVLRVSKAYLHPDRSHVLVVGRRQDFSQELSTLAPDGQVREIDVSIPTSPPDEEAKPEATEEERSAGRQALRAAREALGGEAFGRVENVRMESESSRKTPQGTFEIPSTTTLDLPERLRVEQTLPNGMTVTVADDGQQMLLKTVQGTQPAPPQLRRQVLRKVWHNLIYLFASLDREELEARDLGTKEVEGTEYRAVEVTPPAGEPFTLYLEPGSMRPARMDYTAVTGQGPKATTLVFDDYREVSGLTIPFRMTTHQEGEEVSVTTRSAVRVNVEVPEGFFTLEEEGGAGGSGGGSGGEAEGGG